MLPVEQWIDRAHELGLVGEPTEKALEHSRAFSALVRRYGAERWVDLGSGGGIPGLIVALELPASEGLLVDARQRRAAFLTEAVRALNWSARVRIAAERGEVLARSKEIRERADAVVARGFGAPPVTAEIGSGFVRVGGVIVVSDPPEGAGRRWSASEQLARLGLVVAEVVVGPHFTVLRKVAPLAGQYPRRSGIPERRPLWSEERSSTTLRVGRDDV